MLYKINPLQTDAWKRLQEHFALMKDMQMRDMFQEEPQRFSAFSLTLEDILIDYSKNILSAETLGLLTELAEEAGLKDAIEKMFSGDKINETEGRAALHTALRNRSNNPVYLEGKDIMPQVNTVLKKMESFSNKVISGEWKGYNGRQITDIVNIGIGGSCLGPLMVTEALTPYKKPHINEHLVSNIDGTDIAETLK